MSGTSPQLPTDGVLSILIDASKQHRTELNQTVRSIVTADGLTVKPDSNGVLKLPASTGTSTTTTTTTGGGLTLNAARIASL